MIAWFGFVVSTEIATGARDGCTAVSIRVNVTRRRIGVVRRSSRRTRGRPVVEAHIVSWSLARRPPTTLPLLRVPPKAVLVSVGPAEREPVVEVPQLPV